MQYLPSSTMRRSPSIWPLMRARRLSKSTRRASPIVTRRNGSPFAVRLGTMGRLYPSPLYVEGRPRADKKRDGRAGRVDGACTHDNIMIYEYADESRGRHGSPNRL